MRFVLGFFVVLAFLGVVVGASAQTPVPGLPTGQLAQGRIQPVPEGQLVIGVLDNNISSASPKTQIGGLPGFLVSMDNALNAESSSQTSHLDPGGALFLQADTVYTITSGSALPTNFRFIGFGKGGDLPGALYYTDSMSWGPGAGKVYNVALNREPFSAKSATPWHSHTGPALGLLDGGVWENRQADGITRRVVAPGYYLRPAGGVHQLAQVGDGGVALIVQFFPPGESMTGGGSGLGDATPTVLVSTSTAIARPNPDATLPPPLATTTVIAASPELTSAVSSQAASGSAGVSAWVFILLGLVVIGLVLLVLRRRVKSVGTKD